MYYYYVERIESGPVCHTRFMSTARYKTRDSGCVFKSPEDLAGKPFFATLCERFLQRQVSPDKLFEALIDVAVAPIVSKYERTPKPERRSYDMAKEAKAPKVPKAVGDIEPTDIIRINKDYDGRPRLPGSKVAKVFECYRDGMKVSTWLEKVADLGGKVRHLRKDVARGRISLERKAA